MTWAADLLTLPLDSFLGRVESSLSDLGYVVFPRLLQEGFVAEIQTEIEKFKAEGRFRPAQIGKGAFHQPAPEIRGDGTAWFHPSTSSDTQAKLVQIFEAVREHLNATLFLGLWDWEGHYAVYPPGSYYRKHVDRFSNDSRRAVSMVFFFNSDWTPGDGGALRIERPEGVLEIPPCAGTAVFFLSEGIMHEVAETYRDRLSFAGWFRTR